MGLLSSQTIDGIAEAITGGSGYSSKPSIGIYRTGPQLTTFFRHLGYELQVASRVPSVRKLLTDINALEDAQNHLTRIIEQATDPRDYLEQPDRVAAVVAYLNARLILDGFELRLAGQRHRLVRNAVEAPAMADLKATIAAFDLDSVRRDFDRALMEGDPEDAITAACSTVESVCKCLLDLMGKPYPARQDIGGLVKEVSIHLNLSPARSDITQDIRQILGGLGTVAGGIGALRTHAGDAHGRGKGNARVDDRIARLAVHSASTLSLFFIATWQRMVSQKGPVAASTS